MLLKIAEHFEAIDPGHLQIQQHRIDLTVLELEDCRISIAGFVDGISGVAQKMRQRETLNGRIIAQKNPRFGLCTFGDHKRCALLPFALLYTMWIQAMMKKWGICDFCVFERVLLMGS
jgi:hypothetical protein